MDFRKMFKHNYCHVGILLVLALAVQNTALESKAFFPFNLVEEHNAVAGRIQPESYHGQRVVAITENIVKLTINPLPIQCALESKAFFPFNLVEEHNAVAGRIQPESYHGQRVVAITEGEGHGEETVEEHFLKIDKEVSGRRKTPPTRCCDISMPTNRKSTATAHRHTQPDPTEMAKASSTGDMTTMSDDSTTSNKDIDAVTNHFNVPKQPRVSHINIPDLEDLAEKRVDHTIHIVHKRNVDTNNNPVSTETSVVTTAFVVMDTKAFTVDHDGYIIVDDVEEFHEKELIEFFVLLEDTTTGKALSNPLPFIIYIERPVSGGYPAVPAVFAGVLVLIVVFLAFMIPFVTRAKRRMKLGKPVFKLGSHASTADLERVETFTDMSRTDDSEPEWNGPHTYYNYAAEVKHERSHFGRDLKSFTKSHPPTLQLSKKSKYSSDESGSSGVDVSSQWGAEGTSADETIPSRLNEAAYRDPAQNLNK